MRDLGPYRAVEQIGQGGMAVVLRALAPDGREVAIKLLRAGATRDAVERFTREARTLATLGEGFVPLLDVGASGASIYLVMPLLRGGTLRDRLRRGPLEVQAAVALVIDLARALGRAHRAGIVHRDVKPENVLFDEAGRPWVGDLGIALHLGTAKEARLSRTGELRGTVGYMAPEQVQDARAVGPPADVFALGAILYEALAGRPAFGGATDLEVLACVLEARRDPLRVARPDAPAWLVDVIDGALALDPAARPADGEALARALTRGQVAAKRRPRSRGPVLALVLVLVLVLALVLVFFVTRRQPITPITPIASTAPVAPVAPVATTTTTTTTTSELAPPPPPPPVNEVPSATRLELVATWGADQLRHPGVRDVAILEEPVLAASCGDDATVRLWDVEERTEVARLEAGPGPGFTTLAASVEGTLIAAARADGRVHVWKRATGRLAATLEGHTGEVPRLAFPSGGGRLFSVGLDATLRYWDVSTGAATPALKSWSFRGPLRGFAHGDGLLVVAQLANDDKVGVIDRGSGAGRRVFALRYSPVRDVAVRSDGALAATAHADGWLVAFSPQDQRVLASTSLPGGVAMRLAWTADGACVVALSEAGTLEKLDVAKGLTIERRIMTRLAWRAMALPRSGRVALLAGDGCRLTLWDLDTGDEHWLRAGHIGPVSAVTFAAEGQVISGGADGFRILWNVADGTVVDVLERAEWPIRSAAGRFAAAGEGVWIAAREVATGAGRLLTLNSGAQVHTVALSAGQRWVLTADAKGSIGVWDAESATAQVGDWRPTYALDARGARAATLVERPSGLLVACGGDGGDIAVVRADEPSSVFELTGHQGAVTALAPLGEALLSGGVDGAVVVWDLDTRAATLRVAAGGPLRAIASSSDARHFATVDETGALRLWDGATGAALDAVEDAQATCVAFDPLDPFDAKGASLVAGREDGTIMRLVVRGR